jgi:hypothetical protein
MPGLHLASVNHRLSQTTTSARVNRVYDSLLEKKGKQPA